MSMGVGRLDLDFFKVALFSFFLVPLPIFGFTQSIFLVCSIEKLGGAIGASNPFEYISVHLSTLDLFTIVW